MKGNIHAMAEDDTEFVDFVRGRVALLDSVIADLSAAASRFHAEVQKFLANNETADASGLQASKANLDNAVVNATSVVGQTASAVTPEPVPEPVPAASTEPVVPAASDPPQREAASADTSVPDQGLPGDESVEPVTTTAQEPTAEVWTEPAAATEPVTAAEVPASS